jgi:uncharacterized protein YbcI
VVRRVSGQSFPDDSSRPEVVPITDRPDKGKGADPRGPEDPGGGDAMGEQPTQQQVDDEVAREILRIHTESYGTGAGSSEAFVNDGWVIVVLDDLQLLPNEQFLVENGKYEAVTQVRHQYQRAIQTNLRAAVERATGRTVVGFASTNSVEEPRFAVEIFKLE